MFGLFNPSRRNRSRNRAWRVPCLEWRRTNRPPGSSIGGVARRIMFVGKTCAPRCMAFRPLAEDQFQMIAAGPENLGQRLRDTEAGGEQDRGHRLGLPAAHAVWARRRDRRDPFSGSCRAGSGVSRQDRRRRSARQGRRRHGTQPSEPLRPDANPEGPSSASDVPSKPNRMARLLAIARPANAPRDNGTARVPSEIPFSGMAQHRRFQGRLSRRARSSPAGSVDPSSRA